MTAIRKSGGANVALTTLKRRSGSSWVDIQNGYRRSGGAWAQIYSAYTPVSGSISPSSAVGSNSGTAASGGATTNVVTATGTGGNGSYTFAWTVTGANGAITINSPNSASATFTGAAIPDGVPRTGTANCTISDGTSSVVKSVPITLTWTSVQ